MKHQVAATLFIAAVAYGAPAMAAAPDYSKVIAGRYVAVLSDCIGCHTAEGGKPFAGGLVLQTPFGKLAAPNITPDMVTGIGSWTEEDFRQAVKTGISPGGRRLYPAMPYPAFALISDADIVNLWAYLQTLTPVRNAVRANLLPFPFNQRILMAGWNFLFFNPAAMAPQTGKSVAWNRGAWLVNGPGHCGTCHTPKNIFGADRAVALTGASLQGWFAPDITAHARLGLGSWRVDEVANYLKSGRNNHSMASGPMAEVIENSTSQMTDTDLQAISVYLKDITATAELASGVVVGDDARMRAGAAIYDENCQGCHNRDGSGQNVIFPPLAHNPIVQQPNAETLIRVVLAGTQAAQTAHAPTAPAMPSFAWRLNDAQVADVLTYVRNSWGNATGAVSADRVRNIRSALQSR
jgi:mono/diheme cytochrome c family protein